MACQWCSKDLAHHVEAAVRRRRSTTGAAINLKGGHDAATVQERSEVDAATQLDVRSPKAAYAPATATATAGQRRRAAYTGQPNCLGFSILSSRRVPPSISRPHWLRGLDRQEKILKFWFYKLVKSYYAHNDLFSSLATMLDLT